MTPTGAPAKTVTFPEAVLTLLFIVFAALAGFIASRAHTPAYAFHAALFAVGSSGASVTMRDVFIIP